MICVSVAVSDVTAMTLTDTKHAKRDGSKRVRVAAVVALDDPCRDGAGGHVGDSSQDAARQPRAGEEGRVRRRCLLCGCAGARLERETEGWELCQTAERGMGCRGWRDDSLVWCPALLADTSYRHPQELRVVLVGRVERGEDQREVHAVVVREGRDELDVGILLGLMG